MTSNVFPFWIKLTYSLFVIVIVPVYWRQYGPANFLWFSDIALFGALAALWLESSLIASVMAVSVLVLELTWNVDFFVRLLTGANLVGLSNYMFDSTISMPIRALSLFHVVLPPVIVWMVYRLGYDERALAAQTIVALVVLPLSRLVSTPSENVNWVYGFGHKPQMYLSAPAYVAMLMIAFPLFIYLPTHLALKTLID
jgi:hypothetical protein